MQHNIYGPYFGCNFQSEPDGLLPQLPDVVLRCIIEKLSIQDRCNLAEAHPKFDKIVSESLFWRKLVLADDNAFVNTVCRFVFDHSSLVSEVFKDNVGSPERSFIASWTDVLLSSMRNARKVIVNRSTFLTSGLFVTCTPRLTELRLNSCPNLSAFSLLQGFLCARPNQLKVLNVTGVPGLTEQSAVQLATSCENLEEFDMSGFWGPLICITCVQRIVKGCKALSWFDFLLYIPQSPAWGDLVDKNGGVLDRVVRFGPYVTCILAAKAEDWD